MMYAQDVRQLLALALSLLALRAYGTGGIELASASMSPTRDECVAIARHNTEIQSRLVKQHELCLKAHAASEGDYRASDPCSRRACRPVHLQMNWADKQSRAIHSECLSRVPKTPASVAVDAGQKNGDTSGAVSGSTEDEKRKQWLVRANEVLEKMKLATSIVEKRDRPWLLVEEAWGDAAARIRREVANLDPSAATRSSLDWEVYDLLFNNVYDKTIENARMARNPIAVVINQGMLTKLNVMHADAYNQLNDVLRQVDALGLALPSPAGKQYRPVPFRPQPETPARGPAGSRRSDSGGSDECAVFRDPARSNDLLARDSAAWLALNGKCNSTR